MNTSKKNSGWILRPSKSFPGKFYYFNVLNGDTAWSLEDNEKKDGSPNVIDIHDHPEPSSPPAAELTQLRSSFMGLPYSQPVAKTQSIPEELNVIWAPVQIQVPIVINPNKNTNLSKPRFDKVPPQITMDKGEFNMNSMRVQCKTGKQILEVRKELFVHAGAKPLSQRFLNYEQPVIGFTKDNKIDKLYTSTPIKTSSVQFKTIASNTDVTFDDLKKQVVKEPREVPSKVIKNIFDKKLEECEPKDDGNETDLRLVLQAKKRKCPNTEKIESKKIKTVRQELPSKLKKKVTFEMDFESNSIIDNGYDDEDMNFNDKYAITIQSLKNMAGPGLRDDCWYIAVDTEVLLEEFSFLEKLVKADPTCKLMIPPAVVMEVKALTRGVCDGRVRVTQARNIVRKLPDNHVIVPAMNEVLESSVHDAILNSCLDAMDQNIHLILISNDKELLRTANWYYIQCYNIKDIKDGLPPEPNTAHEKIKLSVPQFTQTGTADSYKSNIFVDLNDKEKEIITRFKKNLPPSRTANEKIMISNPNSRFFHERSKLINKSSLLSNDCSKISNQNVVIPNIPLIHTNSVILNGSLRESTMISINNSTIANTTDAYPNSANANSNSWISNVNSTNSSKALTSKWCTNNDHEKLSKVNGNFELGKEKPFFETNKTDQQTFRTGKETHSKFEFGNEKPIFETNKTKETTMFETENSRSTFEFQKEKPIFETNQTKEPQMTAEEYSQSKFEFRKEKPFFETNKRELQTYETRRQNSHSKFETDVFKKPQSIVKKNNSMVDLREFYVKNKIIENRLMERIDEYKCSFTQIMEDTLSGVLEKLSPTVLKAMPPPWSLYEALQCTKNIYKDHTLIRNIVQELCTAFYEKDVRGMDKMKKNITPNDYMKAVGCGVRLIQYLKNILPPSEELVNTEESLLNMLKSIEDPTSDIVEHLVKIPADSNYDDKEVKHNFVKNRSDIVRYLKKHYPEWQAHDVSQTKVVRTYGRDLNLLKLDKKVTDAKNVQAKIVVTTKNTGDATRNVNFTTRNNDVFTKNEDFGMRNVITTKNAGQTTRNVNFTTRNVDVSTKNDDVEMTNVMTTKNTGDTRNVDVATKNVINVSSNDTVSLRSGKVATKNVGSAANNHSKTELVKMKLMPLQNAEVAQKIIEKTVDVLKPRSFNNKPIEKDQTKVINENNPLNGPKIIRNMKIIDKFENLLKRKRFDDNIDTVYDDDVTYYSTDCKSIKSTTHSESKYLKHAKVDSNNLNINVKIERKSDKDDSTNDSGIGNENSEMQSVVTKFSSKLSGSLDKIRKFIDGTVQEFSCGRLSKKTKKSFRLKAFETNFIMTKMISRLIKAVRTKYGGKVSGENSNKSVQSYKNKEVILRCIKHAQSLQKTLNTVLSVTNKEELNSSMSLNASS